MRCITVSYGQVSGSAKQWPYFQPAEYYTRKTKDGRRIWQYRYHLGRARRSKRLAQQDAMELAKNMGIEYLYNIRNNKEVECA